jgi:restriction endonuclease S subunit
MSACLKPYPSYRDSGVPWLGRIPAHWEAWKMVHAFQNIGSGTTPNTDKEGYFGGEIPWVTTSELRERLITDTDTKLTSQAILDHSALKIHPPGTLLFAMYGATIGRLGVLGVPACVNQACCALSRSKVMQTRFAFFAFQANREHLISLASGGGQPNVNQEKLRSFKLALPPLDEQAAIAEFLDRETEKVDRLVKKEERLIELLQEERTALISHAVTQGLNPNVLKTHSGVPWLGWIPAHWQVKRLKWAVRSGRKGGMLIKGQMASEPADGFFPGYSASGQDVWVEEAEYHEPGIVLSAVGARCGKAFRADGDWTAVANTQVLLPNADFDRDFLWRVFDDEKFWKKGGSAQPYVQVTDSLDRPWAFPNRDEQEAIAEFLDRETEKIDGLVKKEERLIELLQEYRTALITAAVTGQIDVRQPA